jgi:hypothetical protein
VRTIAEGAFSRKFWRFLTGGREVIFTTLDALGVVSAVAAGVAVRLAILALWNLSLFVWFFNFDFRVQKRGYGENVTIIIIWVQVDKEER